MEQGRETSGRSRAVPSAACGKFLLAFFYFVLCSNFFLFFRTENEFTYSQRQENMVDIALHEGTEKLNFKSCTYQSLLDSCIGIQYISTDYCAYRIEWIVVCDWKAGSLLLGIHSPLCKEVHLYFYNIYVPVLFCLFF